MANLSSDKKYVIVERGDTLSEIAQEYLGAASKYKQLATWNDITNPNVIRVGQKIYLSKDGASSGGSSSSKPKSDDLIIDHFGFYAAANDDKTLVATWKWGEPHTASYKVEWTYGTGTGIWFAGDTSSITVDKDAPHLSKYSTYTIPDTAINVRFRVKPVSEKKKDKKGNESDYWTHDWSGYEKFSRSKPLPVLSPPQVTSEGINVKATLDKLETAATESTSAFTHVVFNVIKDDNAKLTHTSSPVKVETGVASYVYKGGVGGKYKVRCRAYNSKTKEYGDWHDDYSQYAYTIPPAPKGITSLRAKSSTSVDIAWSKVNIADGYDIEYSENKSYFDGSGPVTPEEVKCTDKEHPTHCLIGADGSGLTSGKEYFFRVRAKCEQRVSTWTAIKSVILGTKPAAPTTWSSATSVVKSEDEEVIVDLNWIHNSTDGSRMSVTEIRLPDEVGKMHDVTIYPGEELAGQYITFPGTYIDDETQPEPSYACQLHANRYTLGAEVNWQVRTKGIHKEFGEWSTVRTIKVYEQPRLDLNIGVQDSDNGAVLNSFPLLIHATASPNNELQAPNGYQFTIVSKDAYETMDNLGNEKIISAGEEVYNRYFSPDQNGEVVLQLWPNDISLESGNSYVIKCEVSMNSGLSISSALEFSVDWEVEIPRPNAEIGIDNESLAATITPYCRESEMMYRKVNYDKLTKTYIEAEGADEEIYIEPTFGEPEWLDAKKTKLALTNFGRQVFKGMDDDGNDLYFCYFHRELNYGTALLSVYRREYDGRFTEIMTGIDSSVSTTVTDPHPTLDYARYRIVAQDKDTGGISYYDTPGYPVDCNAAVIQWDEAWVNFDATSAGTPEQSPWSGSMLKLPYNIDVSDTNKPECTLVEYAGRSHPVSYYGTHLGSAASWKMDVPKDDIETIYALRRLSRWMGDVYVREPSGSGYWAQVNVSFSLNHCDVAVPVSLSITRVEGGM